MIKGKLIEQYVKTQKVKAEADKKAEAKRKKFERIAKRKQELLDRLESFKIELRDSVIDKSGLIGIDDYNQALERLGMLNQEIESISQSQVQGDTALADLINGIKTSIVEVKGKIAEVKTSIPNLNDFRIETNKRINEVIQQLETRIQSIKVADYSQDIQEFRKEVAQDGVKLRKHISELPAKMKEEIFNVKIVGGQKQNIIAGGGGGIIPFRDAMGNSVKPLVDQTGALVVATASSGTNNAKLNAIDDYSTTDVTYFCEEDSSGNWIFVKIDETGNFPVFTYATINNNPTKTTYALAFADRTTLTYDNYSGVF